MNTTRILLLSTVILFSGINFLCKSILEVSRDMRQEPFLFDSELEMFEVLKMTQIDFKRKEGSTTLIKIEEHDYVFRSCN
jgi:hypothetical protein